MSEPNVETNQDALLQITPESETGANELIHVGLQDLYNELKDQGYTKDAIPIMEHAPDPKTSMEEKRLILKKIVRLKQAIEQQ